MPTETPTTKSPAARKEPFMMVGGFSLTEEQVKVVRLAVLARHNESSTSDKERLRLREVLRAMGISRAALDAKEDFQ